VAVVGESTPATYALAEAVCLRGSDESDNAGGEIDDVPFHVVSALARSFFDSASVPNEASKASAFVVSLLGCAVGAYSYPSP
jgi:hypothetical protein